MWDDNNEWHYSHRNADGHDVNAFGYDKYGSYRGTQLTKPSNSNTSSGSDTGSGPIDMSGIGGLIGIVVVGFILHKIFMFIKANWVSIVTIIGTCVVCAIVCFILHIKAKKAGLKILFVILASIGIIGTVLYSGTRKTEAFFYNLQRNIPELELKTVKETASTSIQTYAANFLQTLKARKEKITAVSLIIAAGIVILIVIRKKKASLEGPTDAESQHILAVNYHDGQGVPVDYAKAAYWCAKAAKQKHVQAQYNLGYLYSIGEGVPKNMAKTIYWCTKAAKQGHAMAQHDLGVCYVTGEGVKRNYKKAVYWYTKATEQEYAPAQCNLGVCYFDGLGVPQNYEKAVYWYTKAAEQGVPDAQCNLGFCYCNGLGVPRDDSKGMYWINKAAEQGNPMALETLKSLNR